MAKNNIKTLWDKIDDKTDFLIKLSEENGRKVNTLRTHWFSKSSNYGVPDSELKFTTTYMQNYIRSQNKVELG